MYAVYVGEFSILAAYGEPPRIIPLLALGLNTSS